MGTVPTPYEMPANGVISSSAFNAGVKDPLTFLLNPPACALRQSAATVLTTAVWGSIGFDLSDEDNYTGHSTTVNNSRYTAVYAGYYMCSGGILFASNAVGARAARWAVTGAAYNAGVSNATVQAVTVASTGTGVVAPTQRLFLDVGSYVELQGFQSSGGNLNAINSVMSIVWAGVS